MPHQVQRFFAWAFARVPLHRLEIPDVGVGHVLGHGEVAALLFDGFVFGFQLRVGFNVLPT
jgi:hypothetical protein